MVHERTTAGDQVGCCFVSNVGFRLRAAVETEFDAVTEEFFLNGSFNCVVHSRDKPRLRALIKIKSPQEHYAYTLGLYVPIVIL